MGVLCDIYAENKKLKNFWTLSNNGAFYMSADNAINTLPSGVREYAGVLSGWGSIGDTSLASLNDQGKTFPEIADIIEQNYEEL